MQQTPIQELISYLETDFDWFFKHSPDNGVLPKIKEKATSLLPTEQTFLQQHAEGFAEWLGNNGWIRDTLVTGKWFKISFKSDAQTVSANINKLYTKYIEYINSLK